MGWIDAIRSLLGLESTERRRPSDVEVTVEREPEATAERAVKEPVEPEGEPTDDAAPATAGEDVETAATESTAETATETESTAEPTEDAEPVAANPGVETADQEPADVEAEDAEATTSDEPDEPLDFEGAEDPVDTVKGIGAAYAQRLADAGVDSVGALAAADAAALAERTDISEKRLGRWIERAEARR